MSNITTINGKLAHRDMGPHNSGGQGRPVVLLHSSASTSSQWTALANALSSERRVIVPDLPGYGRSKGLEADGSPSLDREAEAVFALIEHLDQPVDLIGHSYGGAVAMKIAMRWPERVASLTVIEPVLFHLLRQGDTGDRSLLWQIKLLSSQVVSAVMDRAPARGMRQFVEFWNGEGAWDHLSRDHQEKLVERTGQVQSNFTSILNEKWDLADCRRVTCPVLALTGSETVPASHRVTDLLVSTLPTVVHQAVEGAGHMSPVTHGEVVNNLIQGHLATVDLAALAAESPVGDLATAA